MGAGILLYAKKSNNIYLLLGKEIKNGLWSDFGGSRIGKEEHINTAVREAYEELSGFLGSMIDLKKALGTDPIVISTEYYNSFLMEIEYDENFPIYYNHNFKFIQDKLPHIIDNKHNGLFEKMEIKWYPLKDLEKKYKIFRPYFIPILKKIKNLEL